MKMIFNRLLYFSFSIMTSNSLNAQVNNDSPFKKIKPLPFRLQALPFSSITPQGWLKQELQKNMNGFTGHLDSLAPDLCCRMISMEKPAQ